MKNIKICKVSDREAVKFLKENKAANESVSISSSDEWLGAFVGETLCGVIGKKTIGKSNRIKSFFVKSEYRRTGIGGILIEKIVTSGKFTAFATEKSINLFLKNGFRISSIIKKITFLRKI